MNTLVDLCTGAGALWLHALGGRQLLPPVSWMGGKRRLAGDVFAALGLVDRRELTRIVMVDAGPWGWVWPAVLGEHGPRVCALLRAWGQDKGARELWDWLSEQPPMAGPAEKAAQWLWLQARSASGVPVWWSTGQEAGWRTSANRHRGYDQVAQQTGGAWCACSGGGTPTRVGCRGPSGGMVRPSTISRRIEAIRSAVTKWGGIVDIIHGDVRDIDPVPGAYVTFDPNYQGRTGYGWNCPRPLVLEVSRRWANAGCRVATCEAAPLDIAGWHHLELAPGRKNPEWLTLNHAPVRVPPQQCPLYFDGRSPHELVQVGGL